MDYISLLHDVSNRLFYAPGYGKGLVKQRGKLKGGDASQLSPLTPASFIKWLQLVVKKPGINLRGSVQSLTRGLPFQPVSKGNFLDGNVKKNQSKMGLWNIPSVLSCDIVHIPKKHKIVCYTYVTSLVIWLPL